MQAKTVTVALHLNIMESIFVLYVDVKKLVSIGSHREGNAVVLVSHLQQESLWKMDSQKTMSELHIGDKVQTGISDALCNNYKLH